jgi:hypothetical protein
MDVRNVWEDSMEGSHILIVPILLITLNVSPLTWESCHDAEFYLVCTPAAVACDDVCQLPALLVVSKRSTLGITSCANSQFALLPIVRFQR